MAIFHRAVNMKFDSHPKFAGVSIAKLVGKADGAGLGVSLLLISPGTEIPVHIHEESVDSIYCIEGSGEIFRDGNWHPLGKGDYCLVPAGEEHGVRNGTDGNMKLFIVHSPPLF